MQTSQTALFSHVRHLSVNIGARPSGSLANHQAQEYISDALTSAGLSLELQPYLCPAWECQLTRLELEGEVLEAAANPFSPSCQVEGELVSAGTLAELERLEMRGRLVLLYGALTTRPVAPKAWFLKDEHDERLLALLEAKRPAAVLAVQAHKDLDRIFEDAEFYLPSATLSAEAGRRLLSLTGGRPRLEIAATQTTGETANVIGRLAGANQDKLVICAHYDTKVGTPGATDNASGVALLLELVRRFAGRPLPLSLEFVAFAGEEYLPIGDDEYLRRFPEERFNEIRAVLNFDGAGSRLAPGSMAVFGGSPAFKQLAAVHLAAFPGMIAVEPWPESNHSTFTWRGVPGLAFSSQEGWHLAHTRYDTLDWVSPHKLLEVFELASGLIEALLVLPAGAERA